MIESNLSKACPKAKFRDAAVVTKVVPNNYEPHAAPVESSSRRRGQSDLQAHNTILKGQSIAAGVSKMW
jgi:hypothetical protein